MLKALCSCVSRNKLRNVPACFCNRNISCKLRISAFHSSEEIIYSNKVYSSLKVSTVWYKSAKYSTVQRSALQCSTVHYYTVQYTKIQGINGYKALCLAV